MSRFRKQGYVRYSRDGIVLYQNNLKGLLDNGAASQRRGKLRLMKTKLSVLLLVAAGALLAQLSIGVRIGAPPPPRVVRVQPRSPGEGYSFIDGYWYPVGNRYKWHEGYWTRPAYAGAHWVAPHHDGQRYFEGHWDGDHGQVNHDHKWDKNHDKHRDFDRDHGRQ